MKTFLIAFGKLRTPGARELTDYYLRNVKPWTEVVEVELPTTKISAKSPAEKARARAEEEATLSALLEKRTTRNARLVLLDERGKNFSTTALSGMTEKYRDGGVTELFFAIGSSYGFSEALRKRADVLWCLGEQTLSHELARAVVAEQLYRVWSVLKGHPYHNEG